MDHLTDERLIAYLDGELAGSERDAVEGHLEGCGTCVAALEELRLASRHLTEALERFDRPAPEVDPAGIRALHRTREPEEEPDVLALSGRRPGPEGATRGPGPPGRSDRAGGGEGRARRGGRRASTDPGISRRSLAAAAVLLVLATGAAAAIPGSPVREWVVRTFRTVTATVEEPDRQDEFPSAPAAADRDAGVAVEPAEGAVTVRFVDTSVGAVIRVRFVDGSRAAVRAADARYRTSRGRIEVVGAGSGDIHVELPRTSASARVEAEGRTLLVKRDAEIRVLAPADSTASEIVFRIGG